MAGIDVVYSVTMRVETTLRPEDVKGLIEDGVLRESVMRFGEHCKAQVSGIEIVDE